MRKTFLLGAGASVDAGLPDSMNLTRRIADAVDSRGRWQGTSQALHVVIGAMVQHDTGKGLSAFDGVDVERVFAAVRALTDRDSIDLSAFVQTWNNNVDALGRSSQLPSRWAKDMQEASQGGFHEEHTLKRAFEEGVTALVGGDTGDRFRVLQRQMLDALGKILRVDPERVDYLAPMFASQDIANIATLNYDQSVEKAAMRASRDCDTGLEAWRGGYSWEWRLEANVRLLKLHGSMDFAISKAQSEGMRVQGDLLTYLGEPSDGGGTLVGGVPAVVFGQGSKLRSDGPFLAMLVEFDRVLQDTEWLTIVGYSFRDEHINAALARWMNGPSASRLSVIDPAITRWVADRQVAPDFFRDIQKGAQGHASMSVHDFGYDALDLDLLEVGAAEGLASLHPTP